MWPRMRNFNPAGAKMMLTGVSITIFTPQD